MVYGWTGKILRIDLTEKKSVIEDGLSYTESFIGGRGINAKIIYDEIGKDVSPFDPENLICIGPGVLAGSPAPCSARSTITAMSPRGLLDSSGIGGFIGAEIKFAGYDHIIIQGKSDQPVYIYITNDAVDIKSANHLWGKDPWRTQQLIRQDLNDRDIQSLSIGQAGENLVHFACVLTGKLQSAAGRCGMGAIMGSKNLKAIAVRGKRGIAIAEPEKYLEACLNMHKFIRQSDAYISRRGCVTDKSYFKMYLQGGKFVTGNWEDSNWLAEGFGGLLEDPDKFWENEAQHLQPKGGQQPGCFGCPMYHETYFNIPAQHDIGRIKCVEWLLAGAAWLKNRREVIEAAYLCDKYGLDVSSTGSCLSLLMELFQKGIISKEDTDGIPMKRGDISAVKYAIEKIAKQEGFGKFFRKGVVAGAQLIDRDADKYAMQIKGLELFPVEIRIFKSIALLASVGKAEQLSVIDYYGADNAEAMQKLAEEAFGKKSIAIPNTYEDKAVLAVDSENRHCMGDILGICKTLIPWGPTQSFKTAAHLLSLATGQAYSQEDLSMAAKRTMLIERAFNAIKGIRRQDERPPQKLFKKSVADGKFKGEVLQTEQFEKMLSEYYQLRGCDQEGVPNKAIFEKVGLLSEWKVFNDRMKNGRV